MNDKTASAAYATCIRGLARREHSQLELRQKLLQKEYSPAVVDEVLAKLVADGYQSEARFAEMFCRSRVNRRDGARKIRYAMQQKGVSDALIKQEIVKYDGAFLDNAIHLIRRKLPEGDASVVLADRKQKDKIMQSLFRKGYDFDVIKVAFANV